MHRYQITYKVYGITHVVILVEMILLNLLLVKYVLHNTIEKYTSTNNEVKKLSYKKKSTITMIIVNLVLLGTLLPLYPKTHK